MLLDIWRLPLLLIFLASSAWAQLRWEVVSEGKVSEGPLPRRDAALGYDGARGRVLMFGGRTDIGGREAAHGDLWSYDVKSGSWNELPVTSPWPSARFAAVYGVSEGSLYISTGEGENGVLFNDVWKLDLSSDSWEELPTQSKPSYLTQPQWRVQQRDVEGPAFRSFASGGIFPNSSRLYVSLGLGDDQYIDDAYSYDVKERAWYKENGGNGPYTLDHPHSRYGHAGAMVSDSELLIAGGCLSTVGSGGACPADDSWLYDARTDVWTELNTCGVPSVYASMAMLPIRNGKRRVVMYGGTQETSQVLMTEKVPAQQISVYDAEAKECRAYSTEGAVRSLRESVAMATAADGIYVFGGKIATSGNLSSDLYLLRGSSITVLGDADDASEATVCHPTFINLLLLHGVLMMLGYGLFLQWGAFIGRYLLSKPRQPHGHGFNLHVRFQVFGVLLVIGGFVCGVMSTQGPHFSHTHGIIGLVLTIVAVLQPIIALMKPRVTEDSKPSQTIRRIVWGFFHSWIGRGSLVLALINISLGLYMALAHTAIIYTWFAYVILLSVVYFFTESAMTCRKNFRGGPRLPVSRSNSERLETSSRKYVYMVKDPSEHGSFSRYSLKNPAFEH